jgi:hypothetical protein
VKDEKNDELLNEIRMQRRIGKSYQNNLIQAKTNKNKQKQTKKK